MTLPDTFDVSSVRAVHGDLLAAFADGDAVRIDGASVRRADAAALQLLSAAALEAKRRGIAFDIQSPSPVLIDVADVVGVGALLQLAGIRDGQHPRG